MLFSRPIGGAPLASYVVPDAAPDNFDALIDSRGEDLVAILEIVGFPKSYAPESGGPTPLLGGPLLADIGLAGQSGPSSVTTRTLFLSDMPYRTLPSDTVAPSRWTEARMTRIADVEQTAPISQVASRRSQETVGDLEFADNDRFLLDILDDYSFDGRPAKIHLTKTGAQWVEKATVSFSVIKRITRRRNAARVSLEDAANFLDTPLVPRVYGGNGLRDGSVDLAGFAPPVGFGYVRQAKPLLEDPSIYLYRLSDYGVNAVVSVEERGLAFSFDQDLASYELLRAHVSNMAEGTYATCLVDGSIVIKFAGGSPVDADAIRVTFEGDKSSGTYVDRLGDVMLAMLRYSMGIPESRIDAVSMEALPQFPISYYFGGGAVSPTGAQAFNTIMASAFGCFGSVNNDRVGAKLFYPPSDQVAEHEIVQAEIFSVEEIEPPQEAVWSQSMGWGPNQNPLTRDQLAVGSLTEPQIQERTRTVEGTYYNENPNLFAVNLKSVSGSVPQSVFKTEAGAKDAVDRLMGVWGIYARAYEIEAAFTTADVERGAIVKITHHDLGDKSGQKFLVFGKRLQISKRRVLLSVVG